MSQRFVDTLPDREVEADLADELEELDGIEQCVAVRGSYDGEQLAYQLLVNITGRGLLALHYDEEWRVVYDSADDGAPIAETADRSEMIHRRAHDALYAHADEDPDSNHYETTPPFWTVPDEE
ncbi:hypothetical protein SAMN04487948_12576 [Halogranum amylolyticum]|uniref:DUF7964 domain-containing protein n=1 Tax=Halogranum amylolyticum TaxID=660520 RepID=A0A1H8W982_9EURY|nr:hypothetical protein [Halogranum amylolyticum]SEP24225.1 hypothetical protein SAMN04487948_12576 [Halogranum amylolyticum]